MSKSKENITPEDEAFLMEVIAQNAYPDNDPRKKELPETIEEARALRKKTSKKPVKPDKELSDYESRFLVPVSETARSGKYITIRKEYHDYITFITDFVAKEISLFAYVDNVMTQHFEEHKDTINDLIRNKFQDNIIQNNLIK